MKKKKDIANKFWLKPVGIGPVNELKLKSLFFLKKKQKVRNIF